MYPEQTRAPDYSNDAPYKVDVFKSRLLVTLEQSKIPYAFTRCDGAGWLRNKYEVLFKNILSLSGAIEEFKIDVLTMANERMKIVSLLEIGAVTIARNNESFGDIAAIEFRVSYKDAPATPFLKVKWKRNATRLKRRASYGC